MNAATAKAVAAGSDHIEATGEELFALACKKDHEGIVAKHKFGPYLQDSAQWFKIRNRKYSQWGREKFFERQREVDPDVTVWDSCVFACAQVRKPAESVRRRPSTRIGANRVS